MTLLETIERLEDSAKLATPGVWGVIIHRIVQETPFSKGARVLTLSGGGPIHETGSAISEACADAEYISKANPETILKLCAAVREMEASLKLISQMQSPMGFAGCPIIAEHALDKVDQIFGGE